jgi:hypothetical protein
MKHFKTSRHQLQKETNSKSWTVDVRALEEQSKTTNDQWHLDVFSSLDRLISQVRFIEDERATSQSNRWTMYTSTDHVV